MDDKPQPTMITPEALLAAAYHGPTRTSNSPTSVLYQKAIRASGGEKLFFINYQFWDFSHLAPGRGGVTMVEVDVSFYIPMRGAERPAHTRLNLSVAKGMSIADVEVFFLKAYETFGAVPDIHNND